MTCLLNGFLQRTNNILVAELKLAVFLCPPIKVLAERAARDGHDVTVDHVLLQQICQNF